MAHITQNLIDAAKYLSCVAIVTCVLAVSCKQSVGVSDISLNTHVVTVDSTVGGGSVFISPLKGRYNDQDQVTITATPADGYSFSGWSGTLAGTTNPMSFAITSDQNVIPLFTRNAVPQTYSVSAGSCTGGSISWSPQKTAYNYGDVISVTATPDSGYMFNQWQNDLTGDSLTCPYTITKNASLSASFTKRRWTLMVYMAADNDLESAAIQDFNEMESVALGGAPVTTVVLFDRVAGFDQTNGDWTDTRMYEISTDSDGLNNTIASSRIACPKLGITATGSIELNMSDPVTLQYFVQSAKASYPAEEYCLLIWGHGTGWRGSEGASSFAVSPEKAFAIDDTTGGYMSIGQASKVLKDQGISAMAFDTCFGALLEIGYEFRTSAKYLVGSEGCTPSTGWDYAALFNSFYKSDFSDTSLIDSICAQFSNQYSGVPGMTISAMDLGKMSALRVAFDAFSSAVAATISDSASQKKIRDIMLKNCDLFHASTYPCDVYIDIASLCQQVSASVFDSTVRSSSSALSLAMSNAIIRSWSQDASSKRRIGVNLIPFEAAGTPRLSHDSAYIQGSGSLGQSAFVSDSTGWVPTNDISKDTLLDKVFYFEF